MLRPTPGEVPRWWLSYRHPRRHGNKLLFVWKDCTARFGQDKTNIKTLAVETAYQWLTSLCMSYLREVRAVHHTDTSPPTLIFVSYMIIDISILQHRIWIFPAKLATLRQTSNSAYGRMTVDNLPFPRKRVFSTRNLSNCLLKSVALEGSKHPEYELKRLKRGKK